MSFESIRFKHNLQSDLLLKALDHVKHFIVKHKLILVGGMGLDCSLRLKGLKIYEDDQIPDYDFYSRESVAHGYLLGSELCNLGYPSVDVIAAMHTTTMRVRVDGNVVADITYMPPVIFDKIKTLEYQGMVIVHPWYTMMDQFRALSMPYENPPNEVIFSRWNKDIERFNLLASVYPIGDDTDVKWPKLNIIKIVDKGVIQGWAALAWHENERGIKDLNWNSKTKQASLPVNYCSVMSDDITWGDKHKKFNALFSYPHHIKAEGVEVFDTWGERITIVPNTNIASIPTMMFYFFHTWLLRGDQLSLLGIRRVKNIMEIDAAKKISILSVTPYGDQNWNTTTLFNIARLINYDRVKHWSPMPQNFIKDCEITRSFDIASSPLFAIDESECSEFTTIVPPEELLITPS